MKYFATAFFLLLGVLSMQSQTYEIGGMLGGSNYIGDVGPTDYIVPKDLGVGAMFRWNRSARHSFRFTALLAKISSDDADSPETRRIERNYSFKNSIKELSLGMEYTFWEFDVHSTSTQSSPYLYTGLTYFNYDSLFLERRNNEITKYDTSWALAIPMVVGYKMTVNRFMVIGFEIGARYTLTDNLDGSNPIGDKQNDTSIKFGNLNSNDWYVFSGINVTFAFGRIPCYCSF